VKITLALLTAIVLFIAAGLSANAQDQSKRAVAEELLNLVDMKGTMERSSATVKQMVIQQIQKSNPAPQDPAVEAKLTDFMGKIMDMVSHEMSWDKLKDKYVTLYSDIFTEQELKDITAFYKTPSGQALIKKQPEVMKRSAEMTQKMMGELMPKIHAMTNELKEKNLPQQAPKPESK
jgi:hypothetical protein